MAGSGGTTSKQRNEEQEQERKPVWNVATQGPLPAGREDVYEVVPPPAEVPTFTPTGLSVQDAAAEAKAAAKDS